MEINPFGFSRHNENGEQVIIDEDIIRAFEKDAIHLNFLESKPFLCNIEMYILGDDFYGFEVTKAKGNNRFKIVKDLLNYFKALGFEKCKTYYNILMFPQSELENLVMMYKMKNLL